jgi:hypothetical protein
MGFFEIVEDESNAVDTVANTVKNNEKAVDTVVNSAKNDMNAVDNDGNAEKSSKLFKFVNNLFN